MHRNARLTGWARREIADRHRAGWPLTEIARQLNVSRPTVSKWWGRYLADPDGDWFEDRSSRPQSCPWQTPPEIEAVIVEARQVDKLGPARIGYRLGLPASTVWKVLQRHGLNRLAWMDRPTGRLVRRYEKDRPGELVHIDSKQIAAIPEGGGWWAWGNAHHNLASSRKASRGYEHVHSAVDDHSRLAYSEILPDTRQETTTGFLGRARDWVSQLGIEIEAVMTDNAHTYRSHLFNQALAGIDHIYIRPYQPQQNGKVERFNRTLTDEWVYQRIYTSGADRQQALTEWLHTYNHHRGHTSIGGPPISRVNNLPASYT